MLRTMGYYGSTITTSASQTMRTVRTRFSATDIRNEIITNKFDILTESERYPIVPNFTQWRFPHGKLPDLWQSFSIPNEPEDRSLPRQSNTIQALFSRDISCRVTKHVEGTECAHLVPKSDLIWFEQNDMARYIGYTLFETYISNTSFSYGNPSRAGVEFIDDARNAVLLRSDVHKFFDDKRLAFILKPSAELPSPTALVVHVLIPGSTAELIGLYHNLSLQQLTGISVEYLFARFAWTIFDFLKPFLQQGQKRWICVANVEASETCIREASGEETRQFTLRSKSRSVSPRKRQHNDSEVLEELDYERAEQEPRGRRRKRSFSLESSIAPCSSFGSPIPPAGSGFTYSLEVDSDSNTDLPLSEVPLKKQKTSKLHVGPASLEMK